MNFNKNWTAIPILTIIVLIYLPKIFSQGMFLDGIVYASISRNMAEGVGNFFQPAYIPFKHFLPYFSEHLSLTFFLESIFFRVFGDHYWVDNLYSICILVLTIYMARLEYNLWIDTSDSNRRHYLGILLFLLSPIVIWTYSNNMLEGTMLLFCLLSNLFYLKAHRERQQIYNVFGSICLIFAFYSKGVSALFPLMTPIYFYFLDPKREKSISIALFGFLFPWILFFVLYGSIEPLRNQVDAYVHQQIINTLVHKNAINTEHHFNIFLYFLGEMILVFVVFLLLFFLQRQLQIKQNFRLKRSFVPLLIGLTALVPLSISLKQHHYYVVPSMYYFILAGNIVFEEHILWLNAQVERLLAMRKQIRYGCILLFCVTLFFTWSNCGGYRRDELLIRDIEQLGKKLPMGSSLSYESNDPDWTGLAYLHRLGRYSIHSSNSSNSFTLYFSSDPHQTNYEPYFKGKYIQVYN